MIKAINWSWYWKAIEKIEKGKFLLYILWFIRIVGNKLIDWLAMCSYWENRNRFFRYKSKNAKKLLLNKDIKLGN